MDRLTCMTVFSRVAATRSFSAAARELGISQATASKHVQMLEHWLGTRLLNRTTRQVGLTDAGLNFYLQATRILEDMEVARHAGQGGGLRGHLRVTVPVGFGSTRLGVMLAAFMQQNPELAISVTTGERPVDLIDEGYDLALVASPHALDDPAFVVQRLVSLRCVVCAAPTYLTAQGTPAVPADLARHVCLIDYRHARDVWCFSGPDGETKIAVNGRFRTGNGLLRREVAIAGGGVLLTLEILAEADIAAGRLLPLLPEYEPPRVRLDAVCPAHRVALPKVQQFVSFLAARLRD